MVQLADSLQLATTCLQDHIQIVDLVTAQHNGNLTGSGQVILSGMRASWPCGCIQHHSHIRMGSGVLDYSLHGLNIRVNLMEAFLECEQNVK